MGSISIRLDSSSLDRSTCVARLRISFSNHAPIDAVLLPPPAVHGSAFRSTVATYSFAYNDEYGCPTALDVEPEAMGWNMTSHSPLNPSLYPVSEGPTL